MGFAADAVAMFGKMKDEGFEPDEMTVVSVLGPWGDLGDLSLGRWVQGFVVDNKMELNSFVGSALIGMYEKCVDLSSARRVFDQMRYKDVVTWNAMITGCTSIRTSGAASTTTIVPTLQTQLAPKALSSAATTTEDDMFPMLFHQHTIPISLSLPPAPARPLPNLSHHKTTARIITQKTLQLSSIYYSCRHQLPTLLSAIIITQHQLSQLLAHHNTTTINHHQYHHNTDTTFMSDSHHHSSTGIYAQNGLSDEAMLLFNAMKVEGVNPDKITLIGVLSAAASIGALEFGKLIEAYALERSLQPDIYVGTALIDKKMKSLGMQDLCTCFSWAYPRGLNAIRPPVVNLMKSSFGLIPKIEHYSRMVDLLARAGQVSEAWDFVKKMPEKPDEVILGALLGACQKLRNVDVSEQVMQLFLEMEPSNSGNYVISSKIYDSARMRVLMRQKGVTKTPGCSWIEMGAQVHEFHAGHLFTYILKRFTR
ncbi:pentatricopeptide repeat (PPR-like) superfamily protein [Actinidia rufa]|uniref:Pentatricopeptide repeat (PPR-like) superfamily protein n=1 Tax=Actinidia rufa TaxID=165716 RepID=A0A7J0GCZ8_9ERIC|nr:pentatricopeptide repeat (PPR-like) superfamily protein [Actinidia rufa]